MAALQRLVPELRARGFKFVGLDTLLGSGPIPADPPATNSQHIRGEMLIASLTAARLLTDVVAALLIPFAVIAILRAVVAVAFARLHARRMRMLAEPVDFQPAVSIVVPAYNEAAGIEQAVRSLASSEYPEFEVVVVDDGSTDGTGELVDAMELPRVHVIREPNRGKAEALNTAVAAAVHDVIVSVDADTVFEPETLSELVRPRPTRLAPWRATRRSATASSLLGRWQHIDYVTGFNLDRRSFDVLGCMPTVPGAIGAFRRSALLEVGGFSSDTLAEDTDVTIAMSRRGWKVVYAERARGFTETPATLSGLWRQRYRWSFGTMQSVWKHKGAILRRKATAPVGPAGLAISVLFQVGAAGARAAIEIFALYGILFLDSVVVIGSGWRSTC